MSDAGKILVVDDMKVNVKILSVKLRASGYEVLQAFDGESAVDIARAEKPDVILLDIMMPGMDGFEVTRVLKSDPETDHIPIVLVTALTSIEEKVKGFDAGAEDFIIKPPNQTELLARVRSLVKLKKLEEEARFWTAKKALASPPETALDAAIEEEDAECEKGSVLIVEEDEKTATHWKAALSEMSDCVIARNGNEALGILTGAVPDIVILELSLPDIDGMDLLKRIKKSPDNNEVSVIVTSSGADIETSVRAIDLGADDFLEKPVNALELLARVRGAMRRHKARSKMRSTFDEVFKLSITDPLTGLFNRQYFNCYMDKAIEISKRHKRSFSLMFIDIDCFKKINDTYSHLVGDEVIRGISEVFSDVIRVSDVVARYGGEEFVIVLSDTGIENAAIAAEKVREHVENYRFPGLDETPVTVSIGIAEYRDAEDTAAAVVRRADDALYRAKHGGRNRVESGETTERA